MKRRTMIKAALAVAAVTGLPVSAEVKKHRVVRWIVPLPAGGPTDAVARKLAQLASQKTGQSIIVENKPGANGSIGTAEVARAAPDGSTFAIAIPDTLISVASLIKSPGYDARSDLTLIAKVTHTLPVLIASPKLGVSNIPELIAAAKANPGKITCGTWGAGTLPHLVIKSLESVSGASFLSVPYKGAAPSIQDVLGNNVDLAVAPANMAKQLQQKGLVVPLAVIGGEREALIPNVRTMQEQGINAPIMNSTVWFALVGPKGLPAEVTAYWEQVLHEVARSPEFEKYANASGQIVRFRGSDQFKKELLEEYEITNKLIKSLEIEPA